MHDHESNMKTAQINLKPGRTNVGRIIAVMIAMALIVGIMTAKVSWNKSSAQSNGSGSAATANTTLGPGGTHTCTSDDVGKVIGCVATNTPPMVPVDSDTDNDGIFDSVDACDDKKEDIDGVEDDDGCPELTDGERITELEKQAKGQKGQWDAIAALRGRVNTVEKRVDALEAWQRTVNTSLKVGVAKRRVEQINETFVINGKIATARQVKEFLQKMGQ